VPLEEKQGLLETFDLKARLDKLLELLSRRIEVLKVSKDVDERTRESIGDANRKHLLREQMRTIQKELGDEARTSRPSSRSSRRRSRGEMPEEVEKRRARS
jgi:ATP-dependent Lon protease